MEKEIILNWYKDNKILDVVEEKSFNHIGILEECTAKPIKIKKEVVIKREMQIKQENNFGEKIEIKAKETTKIKNNETTHEYNFNYIYQNLANKYKNDNIKTINSSKGNVEDAIKKAREIANKVNTLQELKNEIENFDGYLEIKNLATNTVFAEGNEKSKIMIIGEAPGNNEDLEGRPFCGQSGELLNNMFKAIGYKREDLYITNTLFWRPPGNRTPTEEEINICRPFVEKHIALINPELIIFMGSTALNDLIKTDLTITKARKHIFEYTNQYLEGNNIKTTPLFHPSYLLRQSSKKKDTWEDLLFIQDLLN